MTWHGKLQPPSRTTRTCVSHIANNMSGSGLTTMAIRNQTDLVTQYAWGISGPTRGGIFIPKINSICSGYSNHRDNSMGHKKLLTKFIISMPSVQIYDSYAHKSSHFPADYSRRAEIIYNRRKLSVMKYMNRARTAVYVHTCSSH